MLINNTRCHYVDTKVNRKILEVQRYLKFPLHTLLAASAEVMPLKLPMLVVMVTVMVMVKVGAVDTGGTIRLAARASVDDVFR